MTVPDFASALAALKHEAVAGKTQALPGGVGYIKDGGVHADFIHFSSVGEGDHLAALGYMKENLPPHIALYLGSAGLLNLSYMGSFEFDHAAFVDVNPLQTLFSDMLIHHLATCPDLDSFTDFLERSETIVGDEARRRFSGIPLIKKGCLSETFDREGSRPLLSSPRLYRGLSPGTWLKTPGADHAWMTPGTYDYLHGKARDEKMAAVTLDLLDQAGCRRLADCFAAAAGESSVLYASSIRKFLGGQTDWTGRRGVDASEKMFWRNADSLLYTPQKYVIEDHGIQRLQAGAPQRIFGF